MPNDPQQVQRLFRAAVDLPPSERPAFLDTACGPDPDLRQRIDTLLSAHEHSQGTLGTPTSGQTDFWPGKTLKGPAVGDPWATHVIEARPLDDRTLAAPGGLEVVGGAYAGEARASVIAGRYTLIEPLGEGGMGEVWVAQQTAPVKRRVALKLIKGGMDSREVIARFEGERQALALMDHPNIARVLDGGLIDGRLPYFVMELVDGMPLTRFCDEARMTLKQRLELFVLICQAVQHAHHKGIVHRDLKPGNILVSIVDGRPVPKVIDFGLAKATEGKLIDGTMATQVGAMVGTLEFMSPEQAGRAGTDVDTRSDIYSLGVILYELLTGLRPIEAKRLKQAGLSELIRMIQEEEPSKPSTRLSTHESLPQLAAARQTEPRTLMTLLSGELDWVVMRCLEKQRERRYATANALAGDIERYLANEPVEARPPTARYRMGKFLQRNQGPVAAAGLVFLALVAGMIGTVIGLVRAMRAEGVAQGEARKADTARHEAQRQLAHGLIAQGDALTLASRSLEAKGRYDEAYEKFGALKEPLLAPRAALWDLSERAGLPLLQTAGSTGPPDYQRCLAIAPDNRTVLCGAANDLKLSDLASGCELRTFTGHTEEVLCLAISPDGQTALSGSADQTLKLWDLPSGALLRTFVGHSGGVGGVAISPDGRTALSGSADQTLKLWDLSDGTELRTFPGHTEGVLCLAISPDGQTALSGSADQTLKLWDLANGEVTRDFAGHTDVVTCVAISSDGQTALSGSQDKTLKLWDLRSGAELRTFTGHADTVLSVAMTRDGRTGLSGSPDTTLKIWDLGSGRELRTCRHRGMVSTVAMSPDGRLALSRILDRSFTLWDLADATNRSSLLEGGTRFVTALAIAADGRSALATAVDRNETSTVIRWDLATGKTLTTLTWDDDPPVNVSIAADGRTALLANPDHSLELRDLTSGEVLRTFSGHAGPVTCLAFSPDGRTALSSSEDQTLRLWDLAGGKCLRTLSGHAAGVTGGAISPDGRTALSTGMDHTLKLWDLVSGEVLRTFTGHEGPVIGVAIAADGRTALSTSLDKTLKLWDLATGEAVRTLTGHTDPACRVAMTADGRNAISVGFDKTLKLWDLADGRELRTFSGHDGFVFFLAASPDGGTVLSADVTGGVRLWDFARAAKGRDLERRSSAALTTLRHDSGDAEALATLGEWYAFRGMEPWAIEFLHRAREGGGAVAAETLARCHWKLGQFTDAQREFQTALDQSPDAAHRAYLAQCLRAVEGDTE